MFDDDAGNVQTQRKNNMVFVCVCVFSQQFPSMQATLTEAQYEQQQNMV